jgi:hypothetical protein
VKLLLLLLAVTRLYAQDLRLSDIFQLAGSDEFAPGSRIYVDFSFWTPDGCALDVARLQANVYLLGTSRSYPVPLMPDPRYCSPQAVLPLDLPSGPAEFVLTFDTGRQVFTFLRIVPFRMLIDSFYGLLRGNQLTHPAIPGNHIVLRTTGAGNTKLSDLTIGLGALRLAPSDFRRNVTEQGIDEVEFIIPSDATPAGCYVPLQVISGQNPSATLMLSVMPSDAPCTHPLGLTAEQLATLDAGGSITVARLYLQSGLYQDAAYFWSSHLSSVDVALITGPQPAGPASGCSGVSLDNDFYMRYSPDYKTNVPMYELAGPGGARITLLPDDQAVYKAQRDSYRSPPWFGGGRWTLTGEAGQRAPAIQWDFDLPPIWRPEIDASRVANHIIEWKWRGSDYAGGEVIRAVFSNRFQTVGCVAEATAGFVRMEIPPDFNVPEDMTGSFYGQVYRLSSPLIQPWTLPDGERGVGVVSFFMSYQLDPPN